nr:uncharacterized protein LOC117605613 isoform X1 [Osmia lignaria]
MKNFNTFVYITVHIFALILIVNCEDENYFEEEISSDELIDPHSFFYDKQSKKMINEPELRMTDNSKENSNNIRSNLNPSKEIDNHSSLERIFYKRLVNLLLSNINIQVKDEVSIIGILEIEISHSQMEILQNFHIQKTSLREIDEILSNVIKKPRTDYLAGVMHVFDTILQKFETVLITVQQHPDGAMIVFAMFMVCLTCRLIKWGQGFPIFLFIQVIFVLSFFMTWWQLIQEAEVKFAAAQMKFTDIPVVCQPNKMNMWDKFVSFISTNEDCEKYYHAKMSNPKLKITPAFALSHFITTVVLHPITYMGTVVSGFITNATDDLPWTYAWIIKCILFLCVGLVIIIMPFCLSGASINLGLGPLLRFGINDQKKSEKGKSLQNVEKREPVQIILQVPHATNVPMIQDVSNIEQPKAVKMLKNDDDGNSTDREDYFEKLNEDLSCGDTIKNTEFSETDDKSKTGKQHDTAKIPKNDGRGDG